MTRLTRRVFVPSLAFPLLLGSRSCFGQEGQATVGDLIVTGNGNIEVLNDGFRIEGKFSLEAKDLTIDGLAVPQLSWGWLGLSLAESLIAGVGALLFSAFNRSLGQGRPSIADLLLQQLDAVRAVVDVNLNEQHLQRSAWLLTSIQKTMDEYNHSPKDYRRLTAAENDAQQLLEELDAIGFPAYPLYMNVSNLSLAILQERGKASGAERHAFARARDAYIAHHESSRKQILVECTERAAALMAAREANRGSRVPSGAVPQSASTIQDASVLAEQRRLNWRVLGLAPQILPRLTAEQVAARFAKSDDNYFQRHFRSAAEKRNTERDLERRRQLNAQRLEETPPLIVTVDWEGLQSKLLRENTEVGDKIVQLWKKAVPSS